MILRHILYKSDFEEMLRQFPSVESAIRCVANRRLERYPSINVLEPQTVHCKSTRAKSWTTMEGLTSMDIEGGVTC